MPVACDVWEGFIFVNLDPEPTQTLTEALGQLADGLAGYPFGEMTQAYKVRSEINSNWKLFIDAFVEFYHAPVLHQRQATAEEAQKLAGYGFEALHYELFSPHSMVSSWGGMSPPKDLEHGQADRAHRAQRPVRPVGQARRHQQQREPAAARQPVEAPGVGHRLVPHLAELHDPRVGTRVVPHVPLLAARPEQAPLRDRALLRPAEDRPRATRPGVRRSRRSRSTRSRTRTRSRRPRR